MKLYFFVVFKSIIHMLINENRPCSLFFTHLYFIMIYYEGFGG